MPVATWPGVHVRGRHGAGRRAVRKSGDRKRVRPRQDSNLRPRAEKAPAVWGAEPSPTWPPSHARSHAGPDFDTDSSGGVAGRVTVDGDLVDDLAVSDGHHDVRRLHGPPPVVVVRPADVRAVDVAPRLPTEAWSALVGVRRWPHVGSLTSPALRPSPTDRPHAASARILPAQNPPRHRRRSTCRWHTRRATARRARAKKRQ
jgi:hypothetical protein